MFNYGNLSVLRKSVGIDIIHQFFTDYINEIVGKSFKAHINSIYKKIWALIFIPSGDVLGNRNSNEITSLTFNYTVSDKGSRCKIKIIYKSINDNRP